jgi:molybdate transport system substrate-binding protein
MTLTPLCWSRQPLRPTAFMPFLLRLTIVLASLLPALADAEQVRVFVAGAAKAGVEALLPGFGHTDGDTIQASYDTAGALRDRVLKGEEPDLVVLSDAAVDALAVRGLIRDGDRREIGVVVVGLAVRQGAPLPDITTADALRRTLLAAKTIGSADAAHGATSGAQFDVAVDGLGVRAQIAPKLTVLPTGGEVLRGVASGKFELGVSQSSEILPVAGVAFVGGLPAPYDLRTPYAIAVLGGSAQGRRLMRYLDSAAAHARFEASGFSTN